MAEHERWREILRELRSGCAEDEKDVPLWAASKRIATLEAQLAEANVELEASRRLLSKHEELRVQADKMAEQRDEMTKQRDSVLTAAYEAFRYLKGRPGTYRADVIAEMLEADLRRAKWM